MGQQFEVVAPGQLRCITQVIVDAVPPGAGANRGYAPIPIYGSCNTTYDQQAGQEADEKFNRTHAASKLLEQQKVEEDLRRVNEEADLGQRKEIALRTLKSRGNPGLRTRRVPGRYHLSLVARLFGRIGEDALVEVEPAWPLGRFTWVWIGGHGVDNFEALQTGYTPTGRFVPMSYGTDGDDVDILYRKRHLPSLGMRYDGRVPTLRDVVTALEKALVR